MSAVSNFRNVGGDLESFIRALRAKGVMLWAEEAGLRYRAPKGVLTPDEREALRGGHLEIASLLECHSRAPFRDTYVNKSVETRRAPLSFTQLEQWYDRLHYGGRPILHLASAFRLLGPLRIEILKESVAAVGRRHDALRTRIVPGEGQIPVQEVAEKYRSDLQVIRLGPLPEDRTGVEVELLIQSAILEAQDYATSPLFKAVLIVVNALEHVLILAMDHMISDLASLRLLSGEVFTAYGQLLEGRPIDLPRISVQFPDYASRLRAQCREVLTWPEKRLGSISRTRFPGDSEGKFLGDRSGFGFIRFVIGQDLLGALRTWARCHGTTIVLATLTAYAALVLRWCDVTETVVLAMTDGRASAELENTIGYLAFNVYIRAALETRSTFLDLLQVVTEEYCKAHDEADFDRAKTQIPRLGFTRNTVVNWLPMGGAETGTLAFGSGMSLRWSAIEFSNPVIRSLTECDEEPGVSFCERENSIICHVGYLRDRFSDERMKRFSDSITEFLTEMLRAPGQRIQDIALK